MQPTRNNRGIAHENGSIEAPHAHLKTVLEQALLRSTRDFDKLASYRRFVDEIIGRANAKRRPAVEAERAALQPLPPRRTTDHDEALVTGVGAWVRLEAEVCPTRRSCQTAGTELGLAM